MKRPRRIPKPTPGPFTLYGARPRLVTRLKLFLQAEWLCVGQAHRRLVNGRHRMFFVAVVAGQAPVDWANGRRIVEALNRKKATWR